MNQTAEQLVVELRLLNHKAREGAEMIDENTFEQVNPDEIEQQEFDVVSEHLIANGVDPDEKN